MRETVDSPAPLDFAEFANSRSQGLVPWTGPPDEFPGLPRISLDFTVFGGKVQKNQVSSKIRAPGVMKSSPD